MSAEEGMTKWTTDWLYRQTILLYFWRNCQLTHLAVNPNYPPHLASGLPPSPSIENPAGVSTLISVTLYMCNCRRSSPGMIQTKVGLPYSSRANLKVIELWLSDGTRSQWTQPKCHTLHGKPVSYARCIPQVRPYAQWSHRYSRRRGGSSIRSPWEPSSSQI